MRVFFGFGQDAAGVSPASATISPNVCDCGRGPNRTGFGKLVLVSRHRREDEIAKVLDRKVREALVGERQRQLARAIGPEVEEDHRIAVARPAAARRRCVGSTNSSFSPRA